MNSLLASLKSSRLLQVVVVLLFLAPLQYYFASRLWRNQPLRSGDRAPDARVLTEAGAEWTPESDSGRVVVLSFWASWCEPCRRELPVLDSLYARLDSTEAVRMYAVNVGESRSTVADHIRRTGLTLPVLYDSAETASRTFSVTALPTLVVIGPDGTVLLAESGFQPWMSELLASIVSRQVEGAFQPFDGNASNVLEQAYEQVQGKHEPKSVDTASQEASR